MTTGGGLVDLGAIDDPTALIDRLVSLNVQLTSTPSSGTGTTAARPTGAFGPCGTAEAPAVALLRWKGVPAVVVPAIGGPSVRSLIDCSELVHL